MMDHEKDGAHVAAPLPEAKQAWITPAVELMVAGDAAGGDSFSGDGGGLS
jgi:hypothetical protein